MSPRASPSPDTIGHALAELLPWLWSALDALPAAVERRARRLWLDTAACACSGLRADEPQRWLAECARGDAGPVVLPGVDQRLGATSASVAMALGACWDEACEGLALAHGRPGVPVVAALWAQLAQATPTWRQLWQSSVAGYEVAARLGARLRIRPGMHVDGTWGAFGAAAAVVCLHGGSWQQASAAVEAAATQLPFTLLRPVRQGANVRNLYLGHSAWLGMQAAQAMRAGFATPQGAVDDFAALALAGADAGPWVAPGRWLILESYWKPFAAVRHLHYGAAAALALRAQGLQPDAIESLRLRVYPEAVQYCGNRAPATALAAQFSLSFGVAAALALGDLSPAAFRVPRFHDPLLRRLEALLTVEPDAQAFPGGERGALLEIDANGRRWRHHQGAVAGDVGYEPSDDDVRAKFSLYTEADAAMAAWAQRVENDPPQATACLPT
jgi:2-methylcitrate dehydratase PrpD